MSVIEYVTRTQCPRCLQYLWSDKTGGGVLCASHCLYTEIQDNVVIRGGKAVTDETDFKRQASEDIGEKESDVTVISITSR